MKHLHHHLLTPLTKLARGKRWLSTINLDDEYFNLALKLATQAGEVVKRGFYRRDKTVHTKTGPADSVTEYDQESEKLIIEGVKARYPTHKFIAEESHAAKGGDFERSDEPTWVIDPIDGTNNFVHGLPIVNVSIAVMVKQQVRVGVIHNPILQETFTAVLGKGAYLNHQRISTSSTTEIPGASILTEYGSDRREHVVKSRIKRIKNVLYAGPRCLRTFGCCTFDMCSVAMGRADLYFENGPKPWDSAAGSIIVTEAGGVVLDVTGMPFDLYSGRVLAAANPTLASKLVSILKNK